MQRAVIVFAVITILGSWLFGVGAWLLQDTLGQLAGLVMLPMMAVPFIAAWIAHRMGGAPGNPFAGLKFGGGGPIMLAWLGGLVVAVFAALACIAIGVHGLDLSMDSYVAKVIEMAEAQGQEMPEQAIPMIKVINGYGTLIGGPLIGVWFLAALYCLGTFPFYGWFARRLLVYGPPTTIGVLIGLGVVSGISGGLMDNPQLGEVGMAGRMGIMAAVAVAFVPAMLWLLLRYKSAVVPAVAQAAYMAGLGAVFVLLSGDAPLLGMPMGLIPMGVALAAGIGLWLWQPLGGDELVVAAVAHDGTPLTPEEAKRWQEEEARYGAGQPADGTVPATQSDAPLLEEKPVPPPPGQDEAAEAHEVGPSPAETKLGDLPPDSKPMDDQNISG